MLITHEPTVRITLFLNQVRNEPPRVALLKLSNVSGHGSEYGFARYWPCVLMAVVTMKKIG